MVGGGRSARRSGAAGGGCATIGTAVTSGFGSGEREAAGVPSIQLGPVHTMDANANGWLGAPIKAPDEAKTGRLREEGNAEWRPKPPVPFGLRPKTPGAALRSLAGCPTRLRLRALRGAFSAAQRVRANSVNRP